MTDENDFKVIWLIPMASTAFIIIFIAVTAWYLIKKKFLNTSKRKKKY